MNNNDYTAVCFGEVLWDFLPDGSKQPGGAPMNAAYHLNQLGVPAAMISRIGNDELGKELFDYFTSKKVSGDYIQKDSSHDTSRVLAKVDGNHVTYDIVKPVAWDFIEYNMALEKLVAGARYFIFGSLGARAETSRRTLFELLEIAPFKILDINLRAPHYEKQTLDYLLQHADILKLNADELDLLSGWYGIEGAEKDKIAALQDKFHLNTILTTRGDKGAIILEDGTFYEHPGFVVKVADTIGSGDSFLAAFLSKYIQGAPLNEAVSFASGIGAFIATQHGACPAYTIPRVLDVMKGFVTNV
ncbi:MAG: carbohydrate kinase [Chitinophagaceae bacterium]|nr:carbohydrate kinase [Chitinophagaceae bacterium]